MATSRDFDIKAYAAEIEGQMKDHEAYGDPGWVFLSHQFVWFCVTNEHFSSL